ncbi:hypothetical protein Tco_0595223 [Tanacetum coccineum]
MKIARGISQKKFLEKLGDLPFRALIDVHKGEQMTLRHEDQSVNFKVGDTKTYSYNIIESVNRDDGKLTFLVKDMFKKLLEISESGNPLLLSALRTILALHLSLPSKECEFQMGRDR